MLARLQARRPWLVASALLLVVALAVSISPPATAKSQTRVSAKVRAEKRRQLLRTVRKHPTVVTKRWFVKRALLYGVDVPVTIRLTPAVDQAGTPAALDDDAIRISLGSDPTAAPLPLGVAAGNVDSTLKGRIGATLRFSQDTSGYGQLGTVELGFSGINLTGTAVDLVDDAADPTCTLMRTGSPMTIGMGTGSQGYVNLLGGNFSLDLHLAFAFASETRSSCADPFTTTSLMDGSGRPPLPMRIDGKFRISPALTADGRVRLGKFAMSGTQADSFVRLHTCTAAPPPACDSTADSELDGRLTTTSFNAEMLVGNVT